MPKRGVIEGIVYEDVTITRPFWWPIWIGPQQQHEPGSALERKCALSYPLDAHCPTQGCIVFANITLRRVLVIDPFLSPGVILGNASTPMHAITFDGVRVKFSAANPLRGALPWGRKYRCEHAAVASVGGTSPAPVCLG